MQVKKSKWERPGHKHAKWRDGTQQRHHHKPTSALASLLRAAMLSHLTSLSTRGRGAVGSATCWRLSEKNQFGIQWSVTGTVNAGHGGVANQTHLFRLQRRPSSLTTSDEVAVTAREEAEVLRPAVAELETADLAGWRARVVEKRMAEAIMATRC